MPSETTLRAALIQRKKQQDEEQARLVAAELEKARKEIAEKDAKAQAENERKIADAEREKKRLVAEAEAKRLAEETGAQDRGHCHRDPEGDRPAKGDGNRRQGGPRPGAA